MGGANQASSGQPAALNPVGGLLKSLEIAGAIPVQKAVHVKAADPMRALLDGGATHVLRPAHSTEEYEGAIPIKVELAAGETTLRQVQGSGTLLTDFETQVIIPLGKVTRLGYKVTWEKEVFDLRDHFGPKVDVILEAGCPTVTMEVAWKLIAAIEDEEIELNRRVRALRAGDPGDLAPSVWRWLKGIRELWPEVPDDLLARVVPTGKWTGEGLPWNRRLRKRFESCESLVIHLFSGPDQGWWKKRLDNSKRSVLCLDKEAGADQDLLSDSVIGYLAELCESSKVDAVLGGPPCRTVSKLRFRRPRPPLLRSRTGLERFGLTGLTDGQRELAVSDAVLWFRQLWLFTLAQEARNEKVMFLKENPRDPEEYKHLGDPNVYPSFYAWPEWAALIQGQV